MERDLNFKRLLRMYMCNLWLIILVGLLAAVGSKFFIKETNVNVLTKSVFLVYDLDETAYGNLDGKKNAYFDAYKSLLNGNAVKKSEVFAEDEVGRLGNTSVAVESSCYTVTLTVPNDGNIEKDEAILDKYIQETEKWMQEKYNDESIQVVTVSESATIGSAQSNKTMIIAIGFIVGAILAAMCLFIWFVLDRKIRTEEDAVYYTGVECFGEIKRRK